jgi:hypothetical protein
MDYRYPAPSLTFDQLLDGLTNAAMEEGEHSATCDDSSGNCEGCNFYADRTAKWQTALTESR